MNINQVINVCSVLLSGIGTLLEIFFITLVLAVPLGLIVALARNSKCRILSWLINTNDIEFIKNDMIEHPEVYTPWFKIAFKELLNHFNK